MATKIQLPKIIDYTNELKDLLLIRERMNVAFPPYNELDLYLKAQAVIDSRIKQVLKSLSSYIERRPIIERR